MPEVFISVKVSQAAAESKAPKKREGEREKSRKMLVVSGGGK